MSASGLDAKRIGLTNNSIGELTTHTDKYQLSISPVGDIVEVTKGSTMLYWLRHPNPAARISYIIGFVSIVIGVISLVASFVLHFCF